jgi:hypothetical protein
MQHQVTHVCISVCTTKAFSSLYKKVPGPIHCGTGSGNCRGGARALSLIIGPGRGWHRLV